MLDQTPVVHVFHYSTIIEKVQSTKEGIDIYSQEKILLTLDNQEPLYALQHRKVYPLQ